MPVGTAADRKSEFNALGLALIWGAQFAIMGIIIGVVLWLT